MSYFIKIDDGKSLRKNLLEGSKLSIQVLKKEIDLKKIRKEKKVVLTKARKELRLLYLLLSRLEKSFPPLTKKEIDELIPKHLKEKNKVNNKKIKSKPSKEKNKEEVPDELKKLELALSRIEEKLKKL